MVKSQSPGKEGKREHIIDCTKVYLDHTARAEMLEYLSFFVVLRALPSLNLPKPLWSHLLKRFCFPRQLVFKPGQQILFAQLHCRFHFNLHLLCSCSEGKCRPADYTKIILWTDMHGVIFLSPASHDKKNLSLFVPFFTPWEPVKANRYDWLKFVTRHVSRILQKHYEPDTQSFSFLFFFLPLLPATSV